MGRSFFMMVRSFTYLFYGIYRLIRKSPYATHHSAKHSADSIIGLIQLISYVPLILFIGFLAEEYLKLDFGILYLVMIGLAGLLNFILRRKYMARSAVELRKILRANTNRASITWVAVLAVLAFAVLVPVITVVLILIVF